MTRRVLWMCGLLLACGSESASPVEDAGSGQEDGADGAEVGDGQADDGAPGDGQDGTSADGEPDDGSMDAGTDDEPDAGDEVPGPLSECPGGSIDRFQSWLATREGTMVPAEGSILRGAGDDYVGQVEWLNAEWHVVPVLTANRFEAQADFGAARGFWLTYSATDAFYVQMRPGFAWDGGAKYLTAIPSTGGAVQTRFFSFDATAWTTLSALGTPDYPYEQARAAVRGFVFVGETPNVIAFHGLRVDGYEPPCL
jgi:hypothetical protein